MKLERMMKWRVRRQSKCSNSEDNEDVRRSLEILDNVLAEFDDHDIFSTDVNTDRIRVNGDEQGSPVFHAHQEKERWEDENGNKLKQNLSSYGAPNGHVQSEVRSLDISTDGTTSQQTFLLDESRRCSAPPVPKRSPGTRLSQRDRPFLAKEQDDIAAKRESFHSLQLTSQNGEYSRPQIAEGRRKAALSVPTPGTLSSSPMDNNVEISNRLRQVEIRDKDPCLEFYLVREDEDAADDDVFFSTPQSNVRCKTSVCQVCGENLSHRRPLSVPALSCDTNKSTMDSTKPKLQGEAHLRRMRLDKKFAKVKLLLKTDQVTGLDKPPPSFKPPPPPTRISPRPGESNPAAVDANKAMTRGLCKTHLDFQLEKVTNNASSCDSSNKRRSHVETMREKYTSNGDIYPEVRKLSASYGDHEHIKIVKSSGLDPKDVTCAKCEERDSGKKISSSSELGQPTENGERDSDKMTDSQTILPTDVLCKNCINKGWTFRSSVYVSHSPSPLRRPPLGLSYSMEEDLSPGVKEISGSPPKTVDAQSDSVLSSPKSSPAAHLSTFSHSASSLGDGSSQSDLDFSTSMDSGKVPLTSIKSLTLPTDMKLGPSPFYSAMEGEHINGTDSKLGVGGLEGMRSSSAPPPPQDKGHWKKDKTGLSKKEKQNKNDTVDSSRQAEEEEVTAEEKPKKRSVWKSILRRK